MIFQRVHRRANLLFSVHGLAEQVGHSLTGKYPTGVFSKSVRLMKTVPIGDGFLFAAGAAAAIAAFPVQARGLEDSLRRGTESKGWTTYGFPPSLNDMPLAYRLRYARKSRTAAHLECARLRRILRRTLVPLRPRFPVLRL